MSFFGVLSDFNFLFSKIYYITKEKIKSIFKIKRYLYDRIDDNFIKDVKEEELENKKHKNKEKKGIIINTNFYTNKHHHKKKHRKDEEEEEESDDSDSDEEEKLKKEKFVGRRSKRILK